jgi:hypothetical protein
MKDINLNIGDIIMKFGWKTISGAVIMGLGYACKALIVVDPIFAVIGDAMIAIGIALAGIGARMAIAKSGKEVK